MAATQRTASDPLPTHEVYGPVIEAHTSGLTIPVISYGLPFYEAVIKHVPEDAKVYILASKTLCEKTNNLSRLKEALGNRVKGVRVGMTPHTLYQECLEVVVDAKSAGADTIMTLGAGSLADAAKFVCDALANDYKDLKDLENVEAANHQKHGDSGEAPADHRKRPTARLILIPTSLSGGEHTPYSGITDRGTKRKYQIYAKQADVTILDPWLCLSTPLDIWLQSGVRGVDHCVEAMLSPKVSAKGSDTAAMGLERLIPGLLDCRHDPDGRNVAARLNAQLGVALAILNVVWLIPLGASHAIGHMLGPMGVGHGETSCILLPAVCKYNAEIKENQDRQAKVCEVLWGIPACRQIFEREQLSGKTVLGDLLDKIIRELGMPRTLKEKGIEGRRVRDLAEMSLKDFWMKTNPRPLTDADEVMKILEQVRG